MLKLIQFRKLMQFLLVFFSLTLFSKQTSSQVPHLDWVKSAGNGDWPCSGMSITVEGSGNSYVTGYFRGTADFDPGLSVSNLTSGTLDNTFIAKYDSEGDLVWAKSLVSTNNQTNWGRCIALDQNKNVLVVGRFVGNIDLDPGPSTFLLTGQSFYNHYIVKLDSNGVFKWGLDLGGKNFGEIFIKTDLSGNAFVVKAGPGISGIVMKISPVGTILWQKDILPTTGQLRVTSMDLDQNGNIVFTGDFIGSIDFDPGFNTHILSNSIFTYFICKLDANGNFIWAKQTAPLLKYHLIDVKFDKNGNIYTTGNFKDSLDFDFGSGMDQKKSTGQFDIFIQKMDPQGNHIWVKSFGSLYRAGSNGEHGRAIAFDKKDDLYLAGNFVDKVDFDPGMGQTFLIADTIPVTKETRSGFVIKLSKNGNLIWARAIGGHFPDNSTFEGPSNCLGIDDSLNIYTTGIFRGYTDFDPDYTTKYLTSTHKGGDMFVHKMCIICDCKTDFTSIQEVSCNQFDFNGNLLTESGTYFDTLENFFGCDSVVKLNLTINFSSSPTKIVDTVCDLFMLDSLQIKTSGTYDWIYKNKFGCDSLVTYNLTINKVNEVSKKYSINPSIVEFFEEIEFRSFDSDGSIIYWDIQGVGRIYKKKHNLSIEDNGVYGVIYNVTDSNGCTFIDTSEIIVRNITLYIPNSFTPNGDGHNDDFGPSGLGIKSFNIQIYDRWGGIFFESTDEFWDGQDAENGVYYFLINIIDEWGDSKEYFGSVALLR